MKHMMKMFVCLVLVLGTVFCLSACGGGDTTTVQETEAVKQYIVGRYELEKIQWASGTTASGEILQGSEDKMGGDMYVELFSDRTAQLCLYGQIKDMEYTDDEMKEINYANNVYEFSVSNGKVILKKDGDTYTFVKK